MTNHRATAQDELPTPDLSGAFPGPFPVSPHTDHVEAGILRWLDKFPLPVEPTSLRTLYNITGQGVSRAVPTADRDSLILFANLFLWLTAFDDVHGEAAAQHDPTELKLHVRELCGILADGEVPPSDRPFAAALGDLLKRFRARATPAQYLQLAERLRANLGGIVWEAQHLPAPESVALDTYSTMRPDTVFVRTVMTAAQIVLGYELPEPQRSSAPVRELETSVSSLAGWVNDLASFKREARQLGKNPLSLPTLLMTEHGVDLPTAFGLAARMCEEQADIARARMTELSASGLAPLTLHAQALEHITHSYIWHIDHARYRP
ncbi:terpene synthase family protein [Streptomyces sp. NPDC050988]|uniref:terpene synthase family protein n=1 Tax=Streptomyces sp. NPDC050988 TaxID=3365637 RepID=UPI003799C088